jgi:hypothetical protein
MRPTIDHLPLSVLVRFRAPLQQIGLNSARMIFERKADVEYGCNVIF